ncbi:hypothetical protein KUTeg_024157 [Tegillarca granosa]|uniref:Uncharacterized protein n=1 Tax=Tegillarca granosa TaxID=220873 RepID=A0ABQ9E1N3_TEGGR|nr:hypothetical protein KUTeg_024157 [Tegillarca granosa]
MPAKSKVSKIDWHECVKCKCLVIGRDLVKHAEDCEKDENCLHSCGHIKDECLHGIISPLTTKEVDGLNIPRSCRDNIVFVNPSAMKMCNIHLGKECIFNDQLIKIAWPSTLISPANIGIQEDLLTDLNCKSSDIIKLEAFTCITELASEVLLHPW